MRNKRKIEDKSYYEANETNSVTVSDSFVTFTKHFEYLGCFVSYNLCNDYDVYIRLTSDSSSMGALNRFWKDISVNLCSKYLIFLAISINILTLGCEIWALRVSLLDKIGVLLNRNIRRILGITMTQVKEERITDERIR